MPFILRLQTLIEAKLEGFASPEMVSITVEILVAVILVAPLVGLFSLANWVVKLRHKTVHLRS